MPPRDRLLRIAVPVLTAACLAATAGWSLLAVDIWDLKREVAELESQRARLLIQHEEHEALTGGSQTVNGFIERTGRSIVPADRVEEVASRLRGDLVEARASEVEVVARPGSGPDGFPVVGVKCVAGSPEVLRVLRGVEGGAELVRPMSLRMEAVEGRSPLVRVEMELEVVTLGEAESGPVAAEAVP